jgi:hypothetical protein
LVVDEEKGIIPENSTRFQGLKLGPAELVTSEPIAPEAKRAEMSVLNSFPFAS